MPQPASQLRSDAVAIWQAGLTAVRSDRLVRDAVQVVQRRLLVGDEVIRLDQVGRIVVVGAGKAGAGMAAALEELLGDNVIAAHQLAGWVNVPADCVRPLGKIHLHAARPAGINEPTAAGVAGTLRILELVEGLGPQDLCFVLISGGGSALLPAPAAGISLEDKLAVTRHLSAAGASIEELNTVRKQLSRIKGGGLARVCRAGRLVSLVISDVLGDPLDLIASGPTVENRTSPADALAVLERYAPAGPGIPHGVFEYLRRRGRVAAPGPRCRVTNLVIGNNAAAVDAAGGEARRRGYDCAMTSQPRSEGLAEPLGCHLAEMALGMRAGAGPDCLISGGEPVVRLVESSRRGRGGRNQQLALAALERLAREEKGTPRVPGPHLCDDHEYMVPASRPFRQMGTVPFFRDIALLAAGTDGEDGPTDAAGAIVDAEVVEAARSRNLDAADFLARNDAYRFFESAGGLFKTGPTHTNVCDVRVVVVARR